MRAIPAYVVGSQGPMLTIKLKTGPTIAIPRRPDLKWGDTAYVLYDYKNMCPAEVWTIEQMKQGVDVVERHWDDIDNPWEEPTIEDILAFLSR